MHCLRFVAVTTLIISATALTGTFAAPAENGDPKENSDPNLGSNRDKLNGTMTIERPFTKTHMDSTMEARIRDSKEGGIVK
ncbi:hypothetical protein IWQ61_004463, partial [Dispira simplex]